MKMAKATEQDIEALKAFLEELEECEQWDAVAQVAIINRHINGIQGWRRVVEGYQVLLDHCCDPNQDVLEWKPEIKELMERVKQPD